MVGEDILDYSLDRSFSIDSIDRMEDRRKSIGTWRRGREGETTSFGFRDEGRWTGITNLMGMNQVYLSH